MTYKQAMKQKCNCGKHGIGGWYGDKKTGRPNFSRISSPRVVYPYIMLYEEHTHDACYAPQKIS